jgi:hypothetical protein
MAGSADARRLSRATFVCEKQVSRGPFANGATTPRIAQ